MSSTGFSERAKESHLNQLGYLERNLVNSINDYLSDYAVLVKQANKTQLTLTISSVKHGGILYKNTFQLAEFNKEFSKVCSLMKKGKLKGSLQNNKEIGRAHV